MKLPLETVKRPGALGIRLPETPFPHPQEDRGEGRRTRRENQELASHSSAGVEMGSN